MSRPSGKSRVGGGPSKKVAPGPPTVDSLRHRRPFMFWTVVLGTLAMVLGTFGMLVSAFA